MFADDDKPEPQNPDPDSPQEPLHFWKAIRVTGIVGIIFIFVVGVMMWGGENGPDGKDPMLKVLMGMAVMDLILVLWAGKKIKQFSDLED